MMDRSRSPPMLRPQSTESLQAAHSKAPPPNGMEMPAAAAAPAGTGAHQPQNSPKMGGPPSFGGGGPGGDGNGGCGGIGTSMGGGSHGSLGGGSLGGGGLGGDLSSGGLGGSGLGGGGLGGGGLGGGGLGGGGLGGGGLGGGGLGGGGLGGGCGLGCGLGGGTSPAGGLGGGCSGLGMTTGSMGMGGGGSMAGTPMVGLGGGSLGGGSCGGSCNQGNAWTSPGGQQGGSSYGNYPPSNNMQPNSMQQPNMMQPNGMQSNSYGGNAGHMQQNQMYGQNHGQQNLGQQHMMHQNNMQQNSMQGNMMHPNMHSPMQQNMMHSGNYQHNGMQQQNMMQNNYHQQGNNMMKGGKWANPQGGMMQQNMMQDETLNPDLLRQGTDQLLGNSGSPRPQMQGQFPQHAMMGGQQFGNKGNFKGKGNYGKSMGGNYGKSMGGNFGGMGRGHMGNMGQMGAPGQMGHPMGQMGAVGGPGGMGMQPAGYQPEAGVGFLIGKKDQRPPPPPPPQPQQPPPPPPETTNQPPASPNSGEADPEFGLRFDMLKKKWPAVDVPTDVWTWTVLELEEFYESGGTKRPKASQPKPVTPRKRAAGEPLEYSVQEALELQRQLHDGFADTPFQDALKRLQLRYPNRKAKGHKDGTAFFEAFEGITLSVHARVLPEWNLTPDWDGVREMISRMTEALKHPKVKKKQEEINMLMGLPRDATFKPPAKGEDLFVYRPNRDGNIPGFSRDLVKDEDGDEGHEFLVEDLETGELRPTGPSALAEAAPPEIWFQVLHKPAVVIRARPDVKADMIGRKKAGKTIRVQKVVDDKWLQLHACELEKLGAQEGWVLMDGAEQGLAGQQLLEKISG